MPFNAHRRWLVVAWMLSASWAHAGAGPTRVLLMPLEVGRTELAGLAEVGSTLLLAALRNRPALEVTSTQEVLTLQSLAAVQRSAGEEVAKGMLKAALDMRITDLVTATLQDAGGLRLVVRRVRVSDATVVHSAEEKLGAQGESALALAVGNAVERLFPFLDYGGTLPRPTRPAWLGLGLLGAAGAGVVCLAGVLFAAGMVAVLIAGAESLGSARFPWPVAALVTTGMALGVLIGVVGLTGLGTGLVAALVGG